MTASGADLSPIEVPRKEQPEYESKQYAAFESLILIIDFSFSHLMVKPELG